VAFNNYEHRTEIAVLNLGDLAALDGGITAINAEVLASHGLSKGEKSVKILGDGEVTRAFQITAAKFSESAKAKIEKAGGQAIVGYSHFRFRIWIFDWWIFSSIGVSDRKSKSRKSKFLPCFPPHDF